MSFTIPQEVFFQNEATSIAEQPQLIRNEYVMGDKIHVGDISQNSGQVSIGRESKIKVSSDDTIAKKTFNWQKWGTIVATVLAIAAIIVSIILG